MKKMWYNKMEINKLFSHEMIVRIFFGKGRERVMRNNHLWGSTGQSASVYLEWRYEIPRNMLKLPLADEPFLVSWQEAAGQGVLDFLSEAFHLPVSAFSWQNIESLAISFTGTLGGRLPIVATKSHLDFRAMEALLNGREKLRALPATVNAFTMQARAKSMDRHRVILLNYAPYSNIPAEAVGISEDEWMERSHKLRLRHECAHYETLRLFGAMKNHALDEILADALGQIAAFGAFDSDRQRQFFGLTRGKETCSGRLSFYCQTVAEDERPKIYKAVNDVLDAVADELNGLLARQADEADILSALAKTSIAERLEAIKNGRAEKNIL